VDEGAGPKVIRDRIAQLFVKNKWPLLDVTSGAYTEEIEKDVLSGMDVHVSSYGLKIVRLGNFEIAIDEADAANLKRLYTDAAYLRTVGGVQAYQQFAAGKAMLGAGEGMAKGGGGEGGGGPLMGGAGLGVGLGLAQMLVQDHRGGTTLAPAAPGVVCARCGKSVPPGKYCSACGAELAEQTAKAVFCAGCGAPMAPDAKFCGQCGKAR
jgi:membrane protease subunit (stomatin/prohibitin family)